MSRFVIIKAQIKRPSSGCSGHRIVDVLRHRRDWRWWSLQVAEMRALEMYNSGVSSDSLFSIRLGGLKCPPMAAAGRGQLISIS